MYFRRFIFRTFRLAHAERSLTQLTRRWYARGYFLHPVGESVLSAISPAQAQSVDPNTRRASRSARHVAWLWGVLGDAYVPEERERFNAFEEFLVHTPGGVPWRSLFTVGPDGNPTISAIAVAQAAGVSVDQLSAIGMESPLGFPDIVDRAIAQLRIMNRPLRVDWESKAGYDLPGRRIHRLSALGPFATHFVVESVAPVAWPFPPSFSMSNAQDTLVRLFAMHISLPTLRRWRDVGVPKEARDMARALGFISRSCRPQWLLEPASYPVELYTFSDVPVTDPSPLPGLGTPGPVPVRQLVHWIHGAINTQSGLMGLKMSGPADAAAVPEESLEALAAWYLSVFPTPDRLVFTVDEFRDALSGLEPVASALDRVKSSQMRVLTRVAQALSGIRRPLAPGIIAAA